MAGKRRRTPLTLAFELVAGFNISGRRWRDHRQQMFHFQWPAKKKKKKKEKWNNQLNEMKWNWRGRKEGGSEGNKWNKWKSKEFFGGFSIIHRRLPSRIFYWRRRRSRRSRRSRRGGGRRGQWWHLWIHN